MSARPAPTLFAAVGSPLAGDDSLDENGLTAHLEAQWQAGLHGVLVGGTMGVMQMLPDPAYVRLIERSAEVERRGELLAGVGDTGLARTMARLEVANRCQVDGTVVLTPYFLDFGPAELVDYFTAIASASRHPVYLYNLPVVTGVNLDLEIIERVAEHPNVVGIKMSCEMDHTRRIAARMGDRLRVIVSRPRLVDRLLREGFDQHLDGLFSVAPLWTAALGRAAVACDWDQAAEWQRRLSQLLDVLARFGVLPAFSAILNAAGISGTFAPAPFRPLASVTRRALLDEPIVQELLADASAEAPTAERRP